MRNCWLSSTSWPCLAVFNLCLSRILQRWNEHFTSRHGDGPSPESLPCFTAMFLQQPRVFKPNTGSRTLFPQQSIVLLAICISRYYKITYTGPLKARALKPLLHCRVIISQRNWHHFSRTARGRTVHGMPPLWQLEKWKSSCTHLQACKHTHQLQACDAIFEPPLNLTRSHPLSNLGLFLLS